MGKKKIIIIASIIVIAIIAIAIFCFFNKNNYKTVEFGNNSIKSAENIKEYILNISSYEASISLEIVSNKNTNKYKIKQSYVSPNIFKQEVIEPSSIQGLTTIYDGNKLTINNTKLALNKIYENYQYISNNSLCLSNFIERYKSSSDKKSEENDDYVIMELKIEEANKYTAYEKLYISKKTLKPIKMEIEDINKKMLVYILYDEIKINSVNKEEVLAFKLKEQLDNI